MKLFCLPGKFLARVKLRVLFTSLLGSRWLQAVPELLEAFHDHLQRDGHLASSRNSAHLSSFSLTYKSRVEELNAMSEPKKVDVSQAQAAIQQIVQSTVQQEVQSASSQEEQASLETTQETTSNNETTQSEVQAYVADDSSRNNAELTNEDVKQSDSSTGSSIRIIIALLLTLAIASVPFIGFKKRKALKTA
jgi:cobalamin biosynthesis Mg chelatase CobN